MVDVLDNIFEPFFGWDIAGTYQGAHEFIDFAIYLLFFIAITRFALSKHFDNKKTRNVLAVVVGIALSVGMVFFSSTYGFMIGDIGPLAGLLLLVFLGFIFYKFLRELGEKMAGAGAFVFLLLLFTIISIVPSFYNQLLDKVPFLEALISFAVFIAVFIVIRDLIKLLTKGNGDDDSEFPGIRDSDEYKKEKDRRKKEKEDAKQRKQDKEQDKDKDKEKEKQQKILDLYKAYFTQIYRVVRSILDADNTVDQEKKNRFYAQFEEIINNKLTSDHKTNQRYALSLIHSANTLGFFEQVKDALEKLRIAPHR